ncbi:alkaline phosphatase D family protein [Aquihabitans sp. McL0605]|uniref:alkaline phosphatase D family protein n=1 Tax=Aquihabitans sp. McL0605 TaxID=3415671 RepID=UPI003CE9AC15
MTDAPAPWLASRRTFLAGALAAAGAALLDPRQLASARARAALLPAGELFPLGVASGDPDATSVILWTRLITPDALDPLPAGDIAVTWEVASDDAFTTIVASGTAPAVAALAHSVHVEATGLQPDTWYWYRFTVDSRTSPVGRTRTFPGAGATPAEVRFGLSCCQNWSDGYYTAYAGMAAEDLQFVVFVGDYIYEKSKTSGPRPLTLAESVDLPTYRARYELYKGDANLQAAHHAFPWIITMDDHEVANDTVSEFGKDGEGAGDPAAIAAFRLRRADAFQVWYEHSPLRLPAPTGADYTLYRTIEHSDLVRFYVLDGRQFRSLYPNGQSVGNDIPQRNAASQSMLGATQEAWLTDRLAATTAQWNVVAQQTVMTATPLHVGGSVVFNFDQWDGYVAARNRMLHSFVTHQVRNPIVLSGDIHLAGAAALRLDYDDPASPDIAFEIVATSISSGFGEDAIPLFEASVAQSPWISYANARKRGYSVCTVTAESFTTDFRVAAATDAPTSTVSTDHTDVVVDRDPVVLPVATTTTTTTVPAETTPTAPPAAPVDGTASYTG